MECRREGGCGGLQESPMEGIYSAGTGQDVEVERDPKTGHQSGIAPQQEPENRSPEAGLDKHLFARLRITDSQMKRVLEISGPLHTYLLFRGAFGCKTSNQIRTEKDAFV